MCWHLTIAVPPQAVAELPSMFATAGGVTPEPDPAVARAVGHGDPCFAVGAGCACSIYRANSPDAERIRHKAVRAGWSASKLARALADADDWSGLAPSAREALATVTERWGRAVVYLFWIGHATVDEILPPVTISPTALRSDPTAIIQGRPVVVAA